MFNNFKKVFLITGITLVFIISLCLNIGCTLRKANGTFDSIDTTVAEGLYEEDLNSTKIEIDDNYVPKLEITNEIRQMSLKKTIYQIGYNDALNSKSDGIPNTPAVALFENSVSRKEYSDTTALAKCYFLEQRDEFVYFNQKYYYDNYELGRKDGSEAREKSISERRKDYL